MFRFTALLLLFTWVYPAFAGDLEGSNISGYDFSYGEIEKNCTAQRVSTDSLAIECKQAKLKPVSRGCEGNVRSGLDDIKLNCGGGLWVMNQRCKIEMRGADRGEINCKL